MSSTADRGERQRACGLHFPSFVPVNLQVTEVVCVVQGVARPLELLEPELARVPTALPVVRARVQQGAHAALEQARDVVLRRHRVLVQPRVERGADGGCARAERGWGGGGDAEEGARGGEVEVGFDRADFEVAEVAEAVLLSWDE